MMTTEPPSKRSLSWHRLSAFSAIVTMAVFFGGEHPARAESVHAGSGQAASGMKLPSEWQLTWSDEFNAANGSSPDPAKWAFDRAGDNSNHELETYTDRPANVDIEDGHLVIAARKEDSTRSGGTVRHYTSGRIFTKGLFSQTYGRFEASIRMPLGKGIWPAFWLLGNDINAVGWPHCGEIDIVENIGEPSISHSTIHGPGYSGSRGPSTKFTLPPGERVDTAFHIYALEWAPNDIKFFFDDYLVAERTPADLPPGTTWVYNHPFFIILNLAVGGDWPGDPDQTTVFPQRMLVDYVRVYKKAANSTASLAVVPAP